MDHIEERNHEIEQFDTELKKYAPKKDSSKKVDELANLIHNKLDEMSDEVIMETLIKCISITQAKKMLLTYELDYYEPKKLDMTLDEFIKKSIRFLNRYQYKVGGDLFDDHEWIIHDHTSDKYNLNSNEIVIENSICRLDKYDMATAEYIVKLTQILNRLSTNVIVTTRLIVSKRDDLNWIVMKCVLKH